MYFPWICSWPLTICSSGTFTALWMIFEDFLFLVWFSFTMSHIREFICSNCVFVCSKTCQLCMHGFCEMYLGETCQLFVFLHWIKKDFSSFCMGSTKPLLKRGSLRRGWSCPQRKLQACCQRTAMLYSDQVPGLDYLMHSLNMEKTQTAEDEVQY